MSYLRISRRGCVPLFGAVHRLVDTAKRGLRIEPDDEEPDAEDKDKDVGPSSGHLTAG